MTVLFSDNFWGEGPKNSGVDVLFQNLKYGLTSTKDVGDFFKERFLAEESHSKTLAKLAKTASNGCPHGSFSPMWQFLKISSEKLSSAHGQLAQKLEEMFREVGKYSDELQKKHKLVKDQESATMEAVQFHLTSKSMVSKTKAIYMQRCLEYEKSQKDVSQKDVEKTEAKMRKAYEEYKSWVEKYQSSTEDYVTKFSAACHRFQDLEAIYLKQMKDFLEAYAVLMEDNHSLIGQIHVGFREMCSQLSIEEMLVKFITSKSTGKERPNPVLETVEDIPTADAISQRSGGSSEDKSSLEKAPIPSEKKREAFKYKGSVDFPNSESSVVGQLDSATSCTPTSSSTNVYNYNLASMGSKWFLRGRRAKKKEKQEQQNGGKADSDTKGGPTLLDLEVDAEGYSVRPQHLHGWGDDQAGANTFYSSSDTDSDEEPSRRLHVEIKPLANGTAPLSASVDELRSTVENMTLSSIGINVTGKRIANDVHIADGHMKRSQSVSQQIGSVSPPQASYPFIAPPLIPSASSNHNSGQNQSAIGKAPTSRYADLGDLFAEVGEIQPSVFMETGRPNRNTPTSNLATSIPRPSSRPRQEALSQHYQVPSSSSASNSPSPMTKVTKAENTLNTGGDSKSAFHFGGSRGPSPLTLGVNDSIPLAVAFHEIIHAYFKGNDETKCQVKMTGDMMLSFPAGIIQVFVANPSPVQLKFRVRSNQTLEQLETKSDLVKLIREDAHSISFEFEPRALVALLKTQAEQNPSASYFNIDVLKYHIKPKPGAKSCPLHLIAFWKCEVQQTDLRIDYKYNSHATELESDDSSSDTSQKTTTESVPLSQICIAAPVDGQVKSMQSKPSGQWFPNTNRACWKIPTLSATSPDHDMGSLRARFDIDSGPSSAGTVAAQFSCEGFTLSGCEFELIDSGYRVSLVKKRFVSGKYICDAKDTP